MRVENMTNSRGNKVVDQFIITEHGKVVPGYFIKRQTFQSYSSTIAVRTIWPDRTRVELDRATWDYNVTIGKYRNQFLGETKKETQKKINSGEYVLVDLN